MLRKYKDFPMNEFIEYMGRSWVYRIYAKELIIIIIIYLLSLVGRPAELIATLDSLDLTLGASPSKAPHDRERGMLLAAENRKQIRQVASSSVNLSKILLKVLRLWSMQGDRQNESAILWSIKILPKFLRLWSFSDRF